MNRLLALALAAGTALSAAAAVTSAQADPTPQRVRGMVAAISADSLTVHPASGSDITVALNSGTKYLQVVKSSLDQVEKGSYIGTATKDLGSQMVALEVVIFPPAMRGTGDGHYGWDQLPDTTLSGHGTTASSMTNGSVESASSASTRTTASSMTNGNVDTASNSGGAKTLKVSYKGGEKTIVVPPTAPIVSFKPAEMSAVKKGDNVFVSGSNDNGTITARAVAVGEDGVKPPM